MTHSFLFVFFGFSPPIPVFIFHPTLVMFFFVPGRTCAGRKERQKYISGVRKLLYFGDDNLERSKTEDKKALELSEKNDYCS
jgi:hypothetical protein